jgi:hypothetical protein
MAAGARAVGTRAPCTVFFTLGISYCVCCFLAKRNKSDREENDEVKNKN